MTPTIVPSSPPMSTPRIAPVGDFSSSTEIIEITIPKPPSIAPVTEMPRVTGRYISSAGISALLTVYKRLDAQGHGVRIANAAGHVRNVFEYAGLEQLFPMD